MPIKECYLLKKVSLLKLRKLNQFLNFKHYFKNGEIMKQLILITALLSTVIFAQEIKIISVMPAIPVTAKAIAAKISVIHELNLVVIEEPRIEFSTELYGYKTYAFDPWSTRSYVCDIFGYKRLESEHFNDHIGLAQEGSKKMPYIAKLNSKAKWSVELSDNSSLPYMGDNYITSIECSIN